MLVALASHPPSAASRCDGVDRSLTDTQRAEWAPAIKQQLAKKKKGIAVPRVDVRQSFSFGDWRILYIEGPVSDPPYLFYRGDPRRSTYRAQWSGAAAAFEQESIQQWTLNTLPGVPIQLASCFAWPVTQERNR